MSRTPAAVTRSLRLPTTRASAWASLADAHGLSGWLADRVEVEVVAGAAGRAIDGDRVRRLVITDVDERRSLSFAWWDEQRPEQVSTVTIELTASDDGGATTVTVTERLAGASVATVDHASVADLAATGAAWDRRLQALVGAPARSAALV